MQISVHNDAGIATQIVAEAEAVGKEVFAKGGLSVDWKNCDQAAETDEETRSCGRASFPDHLQLRILTRPRNQNEMVFGLSYLGADGTGCYSEVFASPVMDLSEGSGQGAAMILGHVMAHEIAHLLLGTNSHAETGIMRARWKWMELKSANQGRLLFTRGESALMRRKVLMAKKQRQKGGERTLEDAD